MRAVDRSIPQGASDGPRLLARLMDLVRRQELLLRGHPMVHRVTCDDLEASTTVWFGVGVATGGGLSQGLPLDVLGLLYTQEFIRQTLGWSRSLVLVADSNAHAAGANALSVRRQARRVEQQLQAVIERLGFPVDVQLSSSLAKFQALPGLSTLREQSLPPYIAHQLAQTELLRRRGIGLKLGWAWPSALHDERYFDDLHAREYSHPVAAIYTGGGTTLDPRRPRACPYVCRDPSTRLMLQSDEDIERKLARAPHIGAQRYRRLLGKLARAHCTLTLTPRSAPSTPLLQGLLDDLPCIG